MQAAAAATDAAEAAAVVAAAAAEAADVAQARVAAFELVDTMHPFTAAYDPSWFDDAPAEKLLEQCMRPFHCSVPDGDLREWLHKRLVLLGHALNKAGNYTMAHTWFICAYALKPQSVAELMSAANMRHKLGQTAVVEEIYRRIVCTELSEWEREVCIHMYMAWRSASGGSSQLSAHSWQHASPPTSPPPSPCAVRPLAPRPCTHHSTPRPSLTT
jgi:hypothetical protein